VFVLTFLSATRISSIFVAISGYVHNLSLFGELTTPTLNSRLPNSDIKLSPLGSCDPTSDMIVSPFMPNSDCLACISTSRLNIYISIVGNDSTITFYKISPSFGPFPSPDACRKWQTRTQQLASGRKRDREGGPRKLLKILSIEDDA